MVDSSLLQGGKQYDLLIDWNRRIKYEIPFLEFFLKQLDPPVKDILEIGCGTGHHAKALLNYGYNLTGIDIDKSMIEEAKKRAKKANFIVMDFLDSTQVIKNKFNAIISLGNSIGLIASSSDFDSVISRFPNFLYASNSIIMFHLLNTEKVREGWSNPRTISNDEGEFLFLRGFSTSKYFIHPEILTLFRETASDDWILFTTGKAKIPRINQKEMISLLERYGFHDVQFFGNYQREIFDPINSVDMIIVARY
jgi:SAM-dependent methyltransferase